MSEKTLKPINGLIMLIALVVTMIASVVLAVAINGLMIPVGIGIFVLAFISLFGLKVVGPQEALVLTLFGNYTGTIREPGFYFVNPFSIAINPAAKTRLGQSGDVDSSSKGKIFIGGGDASVDVDAPSKKKISLKVMTLNNAKQKVNDVLGNPVEIGIAVMWRVQDTAKAVFEVDNFKEYLSLQVDSAVRNIVRVYPYDVAPGIDTTGDGKADDGSLRGSSSLVAERIRQEIEEKIEEAGLEIIEARITHLAYAPEIAAAMLQRQQASAVIDARKMIVEGAVSMVEMAIDQLSENDVVELDDERKAAMVSNLLVVLVGSKDAQPIVNSGSLY